MENEDTGSDFQIANSSMSIRRVLRRLLSTIANYYQISSPTLELLSLTIHLLRRLIAQINQKCTAWSLRKRQTMPTKGMLPSQVPGKNEDSRSLKQQPVLMQPPEKIHA